MSGQYDLSIDCVCNASPGVHGYVTGTCGEGKDPSRFGKPIGYLSADDRWYYVGGSIPVGQGRPPLITPSEPPERKVELRWVIDGKPDRPATPEDVVQLVLTDIKIGPDVLGKAGQWLTAFTNAVTEITREENQK